jgi:hypothetical protein
VSQLLELISSLSVSLSKAPVLLKCLNFLIHIRKPLWNTYLLSYTEIVSFNGSIMDVDSIESFHNIFYVKSIVEDNLSRSPEFWKVHILHSRFSVSVRVLKI